MSAKQELAAAVSALPETASIEEAFERLYQAFREKMRTNPRRRRLGALAGQVRVADDFDAPLPDEVLRAFGAL